ncbi:general substrate transporter [Mariannaea sp. PMI_226]|nr:general substrate transporter [Mariannaea sp. PMI_226]
MPSHDDGHNQLSVGQRLKQLNATLAFLMFYMAACAFNFGYDVGNFGGVQGMQSFTKKFGEYNEKIGIYALPPWLSSLMTSLPFFGKALGAISCGWVAKRWGRRMAIICLVVLSYIGVLLQTTATTSAQFTIGRFISFGMTGMTIVVVPIYASETAPKVLRGMMTTTLQVMINLGQLVASLVTFGTHNIQGDKGWQIPVSLQFICPTLIILLLPLVPESPRWLISQERLDDAKKSLRRLRKSHITDNEIEIEIESIRQAHNMEATEGQGTWGEVFNAQNRLRTLVAVIAMFGQQITGQAFTSQYSVVFYQLQGFKAQAFQFGVYSNIVAMFCLFITWFLVDQVGRRPLVMIGGSAMAIFLFLVAGMSTIAHPNQAEKNTMVASFMLFGASFGLSWAPVSYIIMGEVSAFRVKEKTSLLASVISILTTFVTSFTIPYLLNAPYANLGGKIGFIYGSINVAMVVVAYFFIPELKGRTLEEVDQLFASDKKIHQFADVKTYPVEVMYVEHAKLAEDKIEQSP